MLRPALAGLGLLLVMGGAAWATDPASAPTTSEDFIKALTPVPKTRGLALGTGDTAPAPAASAVPGAVPAAAPGSAPVPATPASKAATSKVATFKAAATQPKEAPRISFQVEFAFNSAELTPTATGILNELGRALTSPDLAAYRFQLTGHTDGVGNPDYNLALSKRRAAAVRDYLTRTFGVSSGRLVAIGRGSQQLLDPANPASDVNRRVEIVNLGS